MVPVVSVERTLLRVEADLAEGDTAMARRRLTSLVGAFPERLDVREHLARVCRMQGDLVQAGRWSYLADERDPIEVATFEKATRRSVKRMRALQWPSAPERASTAVARERLSGLLEQAREQTGKRDLRYETLSARDWQPPRSKRERLGEAVALTIAAVVLVLFVIGVLDGIATAVSWVR
jgi:hypothetical protein